MPTSTSSLFDYQHNAVAKIIQLNGLAGLFAEMGTGKTRIALHYLIVKKAQRTLVICPLSVAWFWKDEAETLGFELPVLVLISGSMAERAQQLRDAPHGALIITNYEATRSELFRKALYKWKPEAVIYDEAHRLKNRTAQQSKVSHSLGTQPYIKHRIALTGTPITQGLQDLYSIYRFINPSVFGKAWGPFRDKYLIYGGYEGRQIIGYQAEAEFKQLVAENSFQISKSEAVSLPERTDVKVPVELDARSRDIYKRFKKDAIAEIEGKDELGNVKSGTILSRIVLTSIMRLQQLTSGFAMTDTGEIHTSNEKLQAVKQLVDDAGESGQRVVIFYRFKWEAKLLASRLELPREAVLDGDTPVEDRRYVQEYLRKYGVLLCQIELGEGITLTDASIGIFVSTGFRLGPFLQSRDRIHRIGQTQKVTYYHIIAKDTIDEKVVTALQSKTKIAGKAIDLDYARQLFA